MNWTDKSPLLIAGRIMGSPGIFAGRIMVIITWAGRYCLVKGGQCILHDQGGIMVFTGPGGRHHGFYRPRWAAS